MGSPETQQDTNFLCATLTGFFYLFESYQCKREGKEKPKIHINYPPTLSVHQQRHNWICCQRHWGGQLIRGDRRGQEGHDSLQILYTEVKPPHLLLKQSSGPKLRTMEAVPSTSPHKPNAWQGMAMEVQWPQAGKPPAHYLKWPSEQGWGGGTSTELLSQEAPFACEQVYFGLRPFPHTSEDALFMAAFYCLLAHPAPLIQFLGRKNLECVR